MNPIARDKTACSDSDLRRRECSPAPIHLAGRKAGIDNPRGAREVNACGEGEEPHSNRHPNKPLVVPAAPDQGPHGQTPGQ